MNFSNLSPFNPVPVTALPPAIPENAYFEWLLSLLPASPQAAEKRNDPAPILPVIHPEVSSLLDAPVDSSSVDENVPSPTPIPHSTNNGVPCVKHNRCKKGDNVQKLTRHGQPRPTKHQFNFTEDVPTTSRDSMVRCQWDGCADSFDPSAWKLHMNKQHWDAVELEANQSEDGRAQCRWDECKKRLLPRNFRRHVLSLHAGTMKIKCKYCGYTGREDQYATFHGLARDCPKRPPSLAAPSTRTPPCLPSSSSLPPPAPRSHRYSPYRRPAPSQQPRAGSSHQPPRAQRPADPLENHAPFTTVSACPASMLPSSGFPIAPPMQPTTPPQPATFNQFPAWSIPHVPAPLPPIPSPPSFTHHRQPSHTPGINLSLDDLEMLKDVARMMEADDSFVFDADAAHYDPLLTGDALTADTTTIARVSPPTVNDLELATFQAANATEADGTVAFNPDAYDNDPLFFGDASTAGSAGTVTTMTRASQPPTANDVNDLSFLEAALNATEADASFVFNPDTDDIDSLFSGDGLTDDNRTPV